MMYHDLNRLQSVFLAVVESADADSRAEVLARECAGDDELRQWVSELLRKHDEAHLAVDTPVLNSLSTCRNKDAAPDWPDDDEINFDTLIAGRYRLLVRLGRGGMGSVFRAEQISPAHRIVAIKVIKSGLQSKSMLARFESEWQSLARMEHPNIARMFDAGAISSEPTEDRRAATARPFFVMEFIDGIPITQYCRQNKLSICQRLELFIPVCEAIEHAHQKGVIHRDLKPSNVLVAIRDGRPTPVVIDFGIAKSIVPGFGYSTQETATGMFLGSLDYMSPEQVERGATDVDTRTDVYSLGAMLYELLCGATPFDPERLRRASMFELATILLEEEAQRPSARVISDPAAVVAAGLGVPGRLTAELRGDLDWIVMKCLEKPRDNRYPSARALADDLARHLHDEAVSAGPPSATYRLRKLMRRYRGTVAAVSLVLIGLIGAIAGTTWGMVHAWRAESSALKALSDKEEALATAEKQKRRADIETANAQAVSRFFQIDVIRQASPEFQQYAGFTPEPSLTIRKALDRAAATIENRFQDQPETEAQIRRSIGVAYDGLGESASALKHLRRAVDLSDQLWGADNELAIRARSELGHTLLHAGRTADAIQVLTPVLEWRRTHLGVDAEKTLQVETDLGLACGSAGRFDDGERLLSHVYECVKSTGPVNTARALYNLACLESTRGKYADAIQKLESIPGLFENGQVTDAVLHMMSLSTLGRVCGFIGRKDDAVRAFEKSRERAVTIWPEEHPQCVLVVGHLANAYCEAGRSADAGRLLEDAYEHLCKKLGPNHERVFDVAVQLATWAAENNDFERAESLSRATLDTVKDKSSITRIDAMTILGRCLAHKKQADEAEQLFRQALELSGQPRHDQWRTAEIRVLLGLALCDLGRLTEAQAELKAGQQGLKSSGNVAPLHARQRIDEAAKGIVACAAAPERK